MKRFFIACAIVAVALPLLAQQTAPKPADPPVETTGVGYGGPRPPTPTGPIPRLPDGTVDLNGAWEGGGAIGNFEREGGLKQGELTALLQPWAKKLMESRSEDDDPHNFCMPDGIGRGSPFVWRFVQNYTHRKPTHLFFIREANIHTYRQIFMDGRKHPEELDPTWMGHSIGLWEGDTLVIDTVGFNDKWWWDRRGYPTYRATAHDRTVDAEGSGSHGAQADGRRSRRVHAPVRSHVPGQAGPGRRNPRVHLPGE